MKFNLLPFASPLLFFVLIGCNEASETTDKPEVEETESSWTLYGGEIGTEPGLAANDVRNLLDDSGQAEARFEGIIDATCAKKGCWMSMVSDEDTVFVQFKDYGFFVPTEGMEGKRAIVQGQASFDTTSVHDLRHFAEDAGKSQEEIDLIIEPKLELKFMADGVLIQD